MYFCIGQQVRHAFVEHHHVIHKRDTSQNLRIKYFYDESVRKITIEKFRIINVRFTRCYMRISDHWMIYQNCLNP